MRVDPANHEQVLCHAVLEQRVLVLRFARVGRALLLRHDETRHDKDIVNISATQHTAHLESLPRVLLGNVQEPVSKLSWQDDGA